jgi:hypothetical protein
MALDLVALVSAELDTGAALGLSARNARPLKVVGTELDVGAEFVVHFAIETRAVKHGGCGGSDGTQQFHRPPGSPKPCKDPGETTRRMRRSSKPGSSRAWIVKTPLLN